MTCLEWLAWLCCCDDYTEDQDLGGTDASAQLDNATVVHTASPKVHQVSTDGNNVGNVVNDAANTVVDGAAAVTDAYATTQSASTTASLSPLPHAIESQSPREVNAYWVYHSYDKHRYCASLEETARWYHDVKLCEVNVAQHEPIVSLTAVVRWLNTNPRARTTISINAPQFVRTLLLDKIVSPDVPCIDALGVNATIRDYFGMHMAQSQYPAQYQTLLNDLALHDVLQTPIVLLAGENAADVS